MGSRKRSALLSLISVSRALRQYRDFGRREPTAYLTGKGQHIDVALFDVATAVMANQGMNYLATGNAPKRLGNAHPNIVPYAVFDCCGRVYHHRLWQ